jgi:hypothetical protein
MLEKSMSTSKLSSNLFETATTMSILEAKQQLLNIKKVQVNLGNKSDNEEVKTIP